MNTPHEIEKRRLIAGRVQYAVVHTATREELGRFYTDTTTNRWRVLMPDANGIPNVLIPESFDTRNAAREFILAAHEPEPEE